MMAINLKFQYIKEVNRKLIYHERWIGFGFGIYGMLMKYLKSYYYTRYLLTNALVLGMGMGACVNF